MSTVSDFLKRALPEWETQLRVAGLQNVRVTMESSFNGVLKIQFAASLPDDEYVAIYHHYPTIVEVLTVTDESAMIAATGRIAIIQMEASIAQKNRLVKAQPQERAESVWVLPNTKWVNVWVGVHPIRSEGGFRAPDYSPQLLKLQDIALMVDEDMVDGEPRFLKTVRPVKTIISSDDEVTLIGLSHSAPPVSTAKEPAAWTKSWKGVIEVTGPSTAFLILGYTAAKELTKAGFILSLLPIGIHAEPREGPLASWVSSLPSWEGTNAVCMEAIHSDSGSQFQVRCFVPTTNRLYVPELSARAQLSNTIRHRYLLVAAKRVSKKPLNLPEALLPILPDLLDVQRGCVRDPDLKEFNYDVHSQLLNSVVDSTEILNMRAATSQWLRRVLQGDASFSPFHVEFPTDHG